MPAIHIPSEDELAAQGGEFSLLPEDQYLVEVVERTIKDKEYPRIEMQPNPYEKTEEYPEGKPRAVLNVCLRVISFANGDPLYDENGEDVTDERFFIALLDTTKVGLRPQPSKFRKFMAAALGQAVNESINIEDWSELIGRRLVAFMRHSKNGKQQVYDFMPRRERPQRRPASAPTAELSAAELEAKAAEVFGDDAPTF